MRFQVVSSAEATVISFGRLCLLGAAGLCILLGAVKLFRPEVFLNWTRRARQKEGISTDSLEGLEANTSWRLNQRVAGILGIGFGSFILYKIIMSLMP